jgi:transposase InsO family protein
MWRRAFGSTPKATTTRLGPFDTRLDDKRVDRLYAEARPQVKRQRRKKVPVGDRQPLLRPQRRNEVWSADFVFDRTAEGRVLKCLTIVDDATTEAVAIVPARALGGRPITRVLDQLAAIDRAGETDAERLRRVLQRPLPRRMPQ